MTIGRHRYLAARYLFERLVVLLILPIALPVMLLVGLAVWLDSRGPILFRQERAGFGGSTFTIIKFRTMVISESAEEPILTQPNDQRITRVGQILRPFHLDELPQLYNVLRGEMSLIGPRPDPMWHTTRCAEVYPEYSLRRSVRPGLTGLAQVELPYVDSVEGVGERLARDIDYIERVGPILDLSILLRTFTGSFSRNGGR